MARAVRAASASSEAFQLRPSRLVTWSRQLPRVAEPAAAGAVTAMSESATMVCEARPSGETLEAVSSVQLNASPD